MVSAGIFDESYLKDPRTWGEDGKPRQHLGVDIPADHGSDVVSPVRGEVIFNNTSVESAFKAYIVIKDSETGDEHVLGHIKSNLQVGVIVEPNDIVGTIQTAGTGAHLHWGLNVSEGGVEGAKGPHPKGGDWGWGRAPEHATKTEANERGWRDPLNPNEPLISDEVH